RRVGLGCIACRFVAFRCLRPQLFVYWHLLEQSSSSVPSQPQRQWKNPLGKFAFAFLALSYSSCDRMDGSVAIPFGARGHLRPCFVHERCDVYHLAAVIGKASWQGFALATSNGLRCEGQTFDCFLYLGDCLGFRKSQDSLCAVFG